MSLMCGTGGRSRQSRLRDCSILHDDAGHVENVHEHVRIYPRGAGTLQVRTLNQTRATVDGETRRYARDVRYADTSLPACTLKRIEATAIVYRFLLRRKNAGCFRSMPTLGHTMCNATGRCRFRDAACTIGQPTKLAGNESNLDHCTPLECAIHHRCRARSYTTAFTRTN